MIQAMKDKFSIIILLAIITISLTGCSKYEKDKSYDTDLYGSYSKNMEAFLSDNVDDINEDTNYSYYLNEKYKLNTDNTFQYNIKEIIENNITKDSSVNGKILSTEKISNDITQIVLDQEITDSSTGETSNKTVYKYENMIGSFYEIEVPKSKTFNLFLKNEYSTLNEGNVFNEDGFYHYCINYDNCDCDKNNFGKYVRKDNIIYFQSMDEEHKDCYTIGYYIVEGGLFTPELYKTEE